MTDLHLSKLIMTVLTFGGISKFPGVNTAAVVFVMNESVTYVSSFQFLVLKLSQCFEAQCNCVNI